ncbi:hypothetical protein ABPG74_015253 [Tetrahymena malaccensis]
MDILKTILDPKELMRQLLIMMKNFYYERLEFALKSFNRNLYLILTIILIHYLQLVSLLFTSNVLNIIAPTNRQVSRQLTQTIIQVVDISRIYPIFFPFFASEDSVKIYFNIVILLINTSFISTLIMQFIFRDNITRMVLGQLSSFVFSIYNFVFLLPFIEVSIYSMFYGQSSVDVAIGIVNILITFFIGIFVAMHDFDFSFIIVDFGSKNESFSYSINVFLESVIAGVFVTNNFTLNQFIHLVASCQRIADLVTNFPYFDRNVSKFNFSLSITYFFLNTVMLIESLFSFSSSTDFSLVIIFTVTISMKSSYLIYDYLILKLTQIPREKIVNQDIASLYIRILYDYFNLRVTHYLDKDKGMFLEYCLHQHKQYCKQNQKQGVDECFCTKYDAKNILNLKIEKQWKLFMCSYIVESFQLFFQLHEKEQKNCSRLKVTYASFLTEVLCQPSVAIREILILKKSCDNEPFKIKWAIQMLNRKVWALYKPVINDKKVQNVRINMSYMLNFDVFIEELMSLIKDQLTDMRQFAIILAGDQIDLNQLQRFSKKLQRVKQVLKRRMSYLFDINPHSPLLFKLAGIYTQYLDFQAKSVKNFTRKSKQLLTQPLLTEGKIYFFSLQLFKYFTFIDKRLCCRYLLTQIMCYPLNSIRLTWLRHNLFFFNSINDLYDQKLGKIMKITQEVQNVLGFDKSDLIGKQIEAIIPELYQKYHSIFIKNFINLGFQSSISKDKLFQFAVNQKGFIVPVDLRVKIDHFSNQDYGVSGLLTKISQLTEYILLTDDFCISNMTEKLYRQCFYFQFKDEYHRIKSIDILRIIPLIGALNFKQSQNLINGKTVNTIMLIPLSKTIMEQLSRKSGHPETELSLLLCKIFIHKYAFFEISADVKKIETSIGKSFYYIQFRQIRRIGRVSEKVCFQLKFNELKKELNRLLGLDLKMTQIDSDDTGKKSNNPFTKTYFYQNGRTFLSNTITNSSIVESTYFKSFATSQYDDDDDDDDNSQYTGNYKVSHQSLRQTHSQFKSQVVEEIKEGQAEEEDEEDTLMQSKNQNTLRNKTESIQLTKSTSKFTSQFGANQNQGYNKKQNTGVLNKKTNSFNTEDMNNSTLYQSASQQQIQDNSFINNQKMDETKEFFQSQRGPHTENDNLMTTYRNEYQGLITKDNNISSIYNNEIDQTNRDFEDYSHANLSDNQIFPSTQRNPLIDNKQFNDVSFAAYDNKTDNDIQQENQDNSRLNSSESKSNEDQFQIDSNHQYSDQNFNTKSNIPSSSASKSSMNSSILKRSQFSPHKSKDDIMKLNSMKSSVASYRLNSSMKQSIRSQENSRRKRMSRLFKRVLRQVKNSMFWIKKLKQQYYFQDENERELAVLRVDGILIKDESERGGDNTKTVKQKIQTQAVISDSDFEDDEFDSPRKLQSMKSINRRKTKQKVPNLSNLKNKKKKASAGGSSSQQQSALQNYNVKKKIIKLMKNKKSTLSIKLIKLFWIVSLLCISFVTFLSFIFNKNNYDAYIANIQEQRLIIEIIESSFQIITNREYEVLTSNTPQNIYPFITQPDQSLLQKYSNDTSSKLEIIKTDFQQIAERINSPNLNYLLTHNMTINEFFDRGPITINQSFYYSLRNFLLMIFQYAIVRIDSQDVVNNILTNYYQFYTEFNNYLTESYNLSQQSLSDTISFVFMTMILVFSVSLANIISMSPIYYYNQVKIEEFLKLFSTFPKDKIEKMIEAYEESYIYVSNLQSGFKQEKDQEYNFSHEIKYKKRSISNTTNFSKMKIWIIFIQLLSFTLFSIYPFVKYIYGYQTYDYFNYGSKELYIFGKSTFLWSSSQGLLYANTNIFLQNQSNQASQILHDFMNNLIKDNQQIINDFYSLQGQFNQKRWYQGQFNSIILNSFQKDACSSVYNNLSFLTASQQVNTQKSTLDECSQMNNSIFTNGILFVLKNYFSIVQEVWSDLFVNQKAASEFVQIFRSLDSKYDFNTIQESYLVFEAILGAVLDATLNILEGIHSQLYAIEINLFVYASIVIFIIFGIGWYYFIRKLQSSLIQAKQILCLMSFESIIENPYIMSYVSKNTQLDV